MHQTQWSAERPLRPPVSLTSQSHHEKPPEVTCTSRGTPGCPLIPLGKQDFTRGWGAGGGMSVRALRECMSESCPVLSDSFTTLQIVACQVPLSMEFSRQEYWSGLPFPSPGDLPDPGIKSRSPALQSESLLSESLGKPLSALRDETKQYASWPC